MIYKKLVNVFIIQHLNLCLLYEDCEECILNICCEERPLPDYYYNVISNPLAKYCYGTMCKRDNCSLCNSGVEDCLFSFICSRYNFREYKSL